MDDEKPSRPKRPAWDIVPAEAVASVPRCPSCRNLFVPRGSDEVECPRCRPEQEVADE